MHDKNEIMETSKTTNTESTRPIDNFQPSKTKNDLSKQKINFGDV